MNETTVIIQHDLDMSPHEFARAIRIALADNPHIQRVRYTDIETILWTHTQERRAGIIDHGHGYGSDDHMRILDRAGYGNPTSTEGVATPDNPDWATMTPAEIVAHEFDPTPAERAVWLRIYGTTHPEF